MSDNHSRAYPIERLSKCNLGDLHRLHKAVYNREQPPRYFEQKYDTAYTGVEHIGFIAYNEQREPIAYYGVIPCFIRHEGQLYLAAQSADTMTHPNYRYKGLFVQLANLTFDLCREEGISVVFGFPNQNSLHGFLVKLKWQMTESMDCFIIPVGIVSVGGAAKRLPFVKELYKQYQGKILEKYLAPMKGIDNSVFKDGFSGINRNAHYLNYKTYHDSYVIKIGPASLWVRISNHLVIGDIDCPAGDLDKVISELRMITLKLGLKEIHFHSSHQTTLAGWFAERYDAIPSFYVLFKDLGSNIPLDKIKFTFADADIF